jgi:hypothetical protein
VPAGRSSCWAGWGGTHTSSLYWQPAWSHRTAALFKSWLSEAACGNSFTRMGCARNMVGHAVVLALVGWPCVLDRASCCVYGGGHVQAWGAAQHASSPT